MAHLTNYSLNKVRLPRADWGWYSVGKLNAELPPRPPPQKKKGSEKFAHANENPMSDDNSSSKRPVLPGLCGVAIY